MGLLVRGREARERGGNAPLEVQFAQTQVDDRALPAGVWVALRRDDVDAAIDVMTAASESRFVIDEREVLGAGYRLESVEEALPLPEVDLLTAQLSRTLDVPLDVLTVIAEWGRDDPRTASEIDELLTCRFGPAHSGAVPFERPASVLPVPGPVPQVAAPAPVPEPSGRLTMSVAEVAQVLRLDQDQVQALAVLVRNAAVTLTAQ
jgi:hypothetical protein